MKLLALALLAFSPVLFGAEFEGTSVSKVLERSGKDLTGEGHSSFSLASEIYRVTTRLESVRERVWDCEDDVPADGTQGDWKGFFNAPAEDKPYRLAAAIQGVGVTTARRLISDGYFNNKPRSWAEFKRRIQEADDEYQTGFSYDVISVHGTENRTNLGYVIEGQCGYKDVFITRRVPVRTFVRHETREYEVRLSGGALLTGERESITVSFDGVEDAIYVNSSYNDYRVDRWSHNGITVFDLVGTRRQVRPSNTLSLSGSAVGGLQLTVSDAGFDSDLAAGEDRFIVGKVQVDARGWKSNADVGSFEKPLSKDSSVTTLKDLGLNIPAGTDLIIHYELRVGGSRYFSGERSSTKKLKLKGK